MVRVMDSQSSGPGFESLSDHYLNLFLGSPEFKSLATLVNILNNVTFNFSHCFQLFARLH